MREGKFIRTLVLLPLAALVVSCSQRAFNSKKELMAFITDTENGYAQKKTVNGVDFSLMYRPTDLLVSQEATDTTDKAILDSLRKKYRQYVYFNVAISKNNKEVLGSATTGRKDFGAMVNQLAFGMGSKVHLFNQSKDTIELLDYIYPREYGMGGATNILFVYPRSKKITENDIIHFTIEDIGLSTGEVGFKLPVQKIKNEPTLNINYK